MPSLFLGKIGTKENNVEIHAFTSSLPFREFSSSKISDPGLFNQLISCRYQLFENGKNMFCTAVNPDINRKTESNPHDTREGTIHFVALNKEGKIDCAVSVAVDTGEIDKGKIIGLPLENRWERNNFPKGQDLDPFRENYLRKHWDKNKDIDSWQMGELYRHFKSASAKNSLSSRLGIYVGCYHLLVREAKIKGLTSTSFWIFDAIPKYFNLYRFAGAAVLRDPLIRNPSLSLSPNPKAILSRLSKSGQKELFYRGEKISRLVSVPLVKKVDGNLEFRMEEIPFLDGIVDLDRSELTGRNDPYLLRYKGVKGLTFNDRIKLIFGSHVIGRRFLLEDSPRSQGLKRNLNKYLLKKLKADYLEFNEIGSRNIRAK